MTAEYVTEPSEIKELLGRQVYSSVKWQQSVERMIADGVDTFIEIGPGRTLTGFLKKINKNATGLHIEKVEDLDAVVKMLGENRHLFSTLTVTYEQVQIIKVYRKYEKRT